MKAPNLNNIKLILRMQPGSPGSIASVDEARKIVKSSPELKQPKEKWRQQRREQAIRQACADLAIPEKKQLKPIIELPEFRSEVKSLII